MDDAVLRLLTLCAIRIDGKSLDWTMIARAGRSGHLDDLWAGYPDPSEPQRLRSSASTMIRAAQGQPMEAAEERVRDEIDAAHRVGARLLTVLDEDYPSNLRKVPDLPPFLFVLGELQKSDDRSVAVVGTRQVSPDGFRRATRLSTELTRAGVTVTSGLARGVDTAAHRAALDAGGRTVAVIGTGVMRCYPAENKQLADEIQRRGAVVSQFWPTRSPGRDTFPRRNRVTSGISLGTAVIEASSTSGAKMQARLAFEHGKRVWLLASLVSAQPWAQKMVEMGRARVMSNTSDILTDIDSPSPTVVSKMATQGTLEFK